VFEKILTLASKSRSSIGQRFSAVAMPLIRINEKVNLYGFRLPTSENIYLFTHDDEITMIDAAYGVYYKDMKDLLRRKSLDPSKVRRIFLTHPDADHAGTSGYFAEEFGTEVYMHPACQGVIDQNNRAYGTTGRLANLNKYYTRLINKFTESTFPATFRHFTVKDSGHEGAFKIIDMLKVGNLQFEVLESHGGHIPGLVFFVNREYGLVFTSDFLINVRSLSPDDREILGVYRYLLTNPNSDTQTYKRESEALKDVIMTLDSALQSSGRHGVVFPGHGDYYRADAIDTVLSRKK
jgi:glyoxylase-like metal-dependent hydrolase (beta-lactamase superfamily II)